MKHYLVPINAYNICVFIYQSKISLKRTGGGRCWRCDSNGGVPAYQWEEKVGDSQWNSRGREDQGALNSSCVHGSPGGRRQPVCLSRKTWESLGLSPLPDLETLLKQEMKAKVELQPGRGLVLWSNTWIHQHGVGDLQDRSMKGNLRSWKESKITTKLRKQFDRALMSMCTHNKECILESVQL
jgi:hypothetical protein